MAQIAYDYAQRSACARRDRRPARLRARRHQRTRRRRRELRLAARDPDGAEGRLLRRRAAARRRWAGACSTSPCRSPPAAPSTGPFASRTRPRRSTRASAATGSCSRASPPSCSPRPPSSAGGSRASSPGRCADSRPAAAAVGAGDLDARAPERDGPARGAVARARLQRDCREARAPPALARRVRRRRLARAAHAAHRAPPPTRERRRRRCAARGRAALRPRREPACRSRAPTPAQHPRRPSTPAACVRERVETWRPLARERDVRLAAKVERAAPVRAGPQRLVQVLDNLLANALDHAPAGTAVTVSADGAPPWVELRVRDEGPGMTTSNAPARSTASGAQSPAQAAQASDSRSCASSSTLTKARSSSRQPPAAVRMRVVRLRRA